METGNDDTGFDGIPNFYPPRGNHEAGKKEEGIKKAGKSDREIENGKSGKGNSCYTAACDVRPCDLCFEFPFYLESFKLKARAKVLQRTNKHPMSVKSTH